MKLRSVASRLAVAFVLAGCGAPPPQAPLPYAKKLDSATSGIATDCGEAYQLTAFPGGRRSDLITLDDNASTSVRKLALVWRQNPDWIYQGETVRQIVGESLEYLGSCGLDRARTELQLQTAKR
jgi:hypothetical protein